MISTIYLIIGKAKRLVMESEPVQDHDNPVLVKRLGPKTISFYRYRFFVGTGS